jgi:hypothetical protein
MKLKSLLWLSIAIVFASCSGSSSKDESVKDETSTEKESTESEKSSGDVTSSMNETEKRIEDLKKLPLITNDQMKALFPQEVMGMKRTEFSVNSMTGFATGTAEYQKDDTTEYRVMLYDCAGEAGSAFYGMKYLTGWNMEREDDNGYEKTVSFMGSKALESHNKNSRTHTLNFVTADRFWVTLEGRNTGLDNLKSFAQALDLEKLKDVK